MRAAGAAVERLRAAGTSLLLSARRLDVALAYVVTSGVVLGTLVLAGQPIYANDTWIHLALGEAFAEKGPWLEFDPYLFAAPGPPATASWLGSVGIWLGYATGGFMGLRIAHALVVLSTLVLAWIVMRGAGATAPVACAGVVAFVALSTYRIVQLRPDLFTIAATLALHPILFAPRAGPSGHRIAASALLSGLWANVHASFLLGPLLALVASAGVAFSLVLPERGVALRIRSTPAVQRGRALRLAIAGLAMLVASLANPRGIGAHLAYLEAGRSTAPLESIADEWNPTILFAWPVPLLPPTLASWTIFWLCIVGVVGVTSALVVARWVDDRKRAESIDPALLAVAGAGLVAAVLASRFLWLGIFALAVVGAFASRWIRDVDDTPEDPLEPDPENRPGDRGSSQQQPRSPRSRSRLAGGGVALFTVSVAALHVLAGDWPLVSRAMRAEGADYAAPYPTERYNTHAIWFLVDSGVEGRVFNDYPLGGFMSFWLAPKLKMASSGTMNVSKDAMDANFAIAARRTLRPGEDYAALLDRQGFDLFLGAGYPIDATPGRPIPCTTRHLEHEPGWILVFRNLRSAVYLRRNTANETNLERIAAYYAKAGIDFDRVRGFDTEKVARAAPAWAFEHGLVPVDFEALVAHVESQRKQRQVDQQTHRLAILYATLGLYERALQIDRFIQQVDPGDSLSAWRVLWSLVQLGYWDEAKAAAREFDARSRAGRTTGSSPWTTVVENLRSAAPTERATRIAHLPVLQPEQIDWLRSGVAAAPARLTRPDPAP